MSNILNFQGDTPTGERKPRSQRTWNKLRANDDILKQEMAEIAIKYPPLQDGLINPGEDRWNIDNDPVTGEPIKYENGIAYTDSTRANMGLDWNGDESNMSDASENFWSSNSNNNNSNNNSDNNSNGGSNMTTNQWDQQRGYSNNTSYDNNNNAGGMNWGINPNQQNTRRDRRDRRYGDGGQNQNVSDDVKSDLAELAKWSQETTPNIKVNGNLNNKDQEAIIKAFEKLSVKGLKKIAEALDEEEYSALQTIMTVIGFGDQFTSATVGANPLALDQKTIIKMFKELKDVVDADGRADDMRTLKFSRLTQKLVAGETIKSDDVYEMLNEMIDSGVINPKRIGTDPTKTHLIVCINKAEEWLNKKSGDFGGAYGAYDIGNQWTTSSDTNSYSYGNVGASNDVWGSTTSTSSTGDGGYYDSLNSRRSRRKNSRNNDVYGYDLTPDYDYGRADNGIDLTDMSMNNGYQGDYDPVVASVRERDRREGVVRRDRRYQSSRNDGYAAAYQPYSGSADDFITL